MIVLNNSSSYNITPGTGGTLTMDNSGLPAQIFDARGNHIISAPMILNDYTTVTIANNADTLNLAGSISGPKGLTINGPGNLILWGSNSYSGGTLINSGILTAAGVSSLPGGVSVLNNGALVINASNTVGGIFGAGTLTIGSGATLQLTQSASLNWQSKLTILGTGNLDITNSSLTLAYGANPSPNAAIQSYLASGYNAAGALWTGTGISSSMAAANPARYSIAFADGADGEVTHLPPGISNVIPNGGALPAGTELITYALPGDANLDGKVDFNDFVVIATHFLQPDINWDHGNFNYDSRVDFLDFVVMATNFGAGVTTSAGEGVSIAQLDQFNSFAAANGISQTQISTWDHKLQSLPDPGAAGMGLIFTFFLLRGRRQRVVNRAANPDRPACVRSPQVRTCRDHAVEHTCR
jgi:autotransporter-associated beta strand protein